MTIRLFPEQFLRDNACFGLFRLGGEHEIDLPISIEGDPGVPLHIVHSDPDHLAYLVGLIVMQAWTSGITEMESPTTSRTPLLVVTDRGGRFGEAYLQLHLPIEKIKDLFRKRRIALFQKTGRDRDEAPGMSEFLDLRLNREDERTKLHNFFPAYQILSASGTPRILSGRQYLGRGDETGPAVLITRMSDKVTLRALQERYRPFLAILDAYAGTVPVMDSGIPVIVYHDSIFAPELVRSDTGQTAPYCLPDARFERFCSQADLVVIEPQESDILIKSWQRVDGALEALIERMDQHRDLVIVEIYRVASRLRNLLLSLPVGIESYEQALLASGQPESLWYQWSITQPLLGLENRLPEMAAIGNWEELILQELVAGFKQLKDLLQQDSPKTEPLLAAVTRSVNSSRRVSLVVSSPSVARGLEWVIRFPRPRGLELPSEKVTAMSSGEIHELGQDQDCIIHEAFDPHVIFSRMARAGPRRITFILLRNELRFVGERFLRLRRLFPHHHANETILRPMYQQLDRLQPTTRMSASSCTPTLFADSDYEMVMRMFNQGRHVVEHGTVLVEQPERSEDMANTEAEACLVRLEGHRVVFLDRIARVSYVQIDDTITVGPVEVLEPGHRLIIVDPAARESIAHRILTAKRGEETDQSSSQTIKRWQQELAQGIERLSLNYSETLRKIQGRGSQRISPLVIGQWARGDVLGPLDVQDIRRIGEAVGSAWLIQNWQRVGLALLMIRSGHRLLGRQITRVIQRAAVGDYELSRQDQEFLQQIGINMGELQDAVSLLVIEAVSGGKVLVPVDQIGKVISV